VKRILIPIDGTKRSMKSVELVKNLYLPDTVDITVVMVKEDIDMMHSELEYDKVKKEIDPMISEVEIQLSGFAVNKCVAFGKAGEEILNCAEKNNIDVIIMTKSTKKGWSRLIGSVTTYVVKYAKCIVMIVPELY
jgi:nucleotide-binding universal stress UspA family protein